MDCTYAYFVLRLRCNERCILLQSFAERLQLAWNKLQTDVNCFMDSSNDKNLKAPNGIQQVSNYHNLSPTSIEVSPRK